VPPAPATPILIQTAEKLDDELQKRIARENELRDPANFLECAGGSGGASPPKQAPAPPEAALPRPRERRGLLCPCRWRGRTNGPALSTHPSSICLAPPPPRGPARYFLPRPLRLAFFGGSALSCAIGTAIAAARLAASLSAPDPLLAPDVPVGGGGPLQDVVVNLIGAAQGARTSHRIPVG
jgi:hypothetical protein